MQGWHYGKAMASISANKISLRQGQSCTERKHLLTTPKI